MLAEAKPITLASWDAGCPVRALGRKRVVKKSIGSDYERNHREAKILPPSSARKRSLTHVRKEDKVGKIEREGAQQMHLRTEKPVVQKFMRCEISFFSSSSSSPQTLARTHKSIWREKLHPFFSTPPVVGKPLLDSAGQ